MSEQLSSQVVPKDWSTVRIEGFSPKEAQVVRANILCNLLGDPESIDMDENEKDDGRKEVVAITLKRDELHVCAKPQAFFERLQSTIPGIKLDFAA